MKRHFLLGLLLLPGFATATPEGERTFQKACVSCHTLTPQPSAATLKKAGGERMKQQPRPAGEKRVELTSKVRQTPSAELRTWITNPHRVKDNTRCDTRGMSPTELDALLAYLKTSSRPPSPPPEVRLREQLQKDLETRRAQQRTDGIQTYKPAQGKSR
ncbi:cytochrome c [Myxococcus sp. K38C18041901]|uniref:c-type cytochrome n=1 Tax=Myxococcus guangdongensis TaxID=2906760 RepID=UPI0020A7FFA5|nr:c-type cytochrome [Myxococcus guangdongensis]MCP3063025.1 cytochrome c [Myxococcus guangdongensis]